MLALGNTNSGIACVSSNVAGATVGGPAPEARNVISGNNIGIWLSQTNGQNVIQGNYIGTTADGASPLGNYDGIHMNVGGIQLIGASAGEEHHRVQRLAGVCDRNGGSKNRIAATRSTTTPLSASTSTSPARFQRPLDADGRSMSSELPISSRSAPGTAGSGSSASSQAQQHGLHDLRPGLYSTRRAPTSRLVEGEPTSAPRSHDRPTATRPST
jgi:hypothetical protein